MVATIECLPDEALENVYGHMQLKSLARSEQVCKRWKQIICGGHTSFWAKLFDKKINFSVSHNVLEIKKCYQRQFCLLHNVRSDKMLIRSIKDTRPDLTDEPLVSRDCVIFPLLRQILGKLVCFTPSVSSPEKNLLEVKSKKTFGGYLQAVIKTIFYKLPPKYPPEWTVSSQLDFGASVFPRFSYQGRKNKHPEGWLETGSATCFLGTGFSLQQVGKTTLLINQFFYMIWNSHLRCEFVMASTNPFLIRDGDTVFHQEGSWLVSYDVVTKNYTGGMNILENNTVLPEFAYVFSNSRILVPTTEGCLIMC